MTTPKKILLVNQYFYPDMAATSQLLGDLACELGSKGWTVMALAGRGGYANGETMERRSRIVWKGVSVRRVWCTNFGRGNIVGRLCDYVTYLVSAGAALALSHRPDVVVCLSTPPFVAALGLIARLKGSRWVYKVEDLYPEVAVALSMLREKSLFTRFLLWLSRFLLKRADSVVSLDEAMTKRLRKAGARSIETIPNWADGAAIRPDRQLGRSFRQIHRLEGRFIVLYSGNLGLAHRFDAVIEAAQRCRNEFPSVLFLFVGDGARLNEVREAASGMGNVRFMSYQARDTLNELYNAADIHLVTLRDEVAGLLFPSKYPAALAAGKPVLLVGGKQTPLGREIQRHRLGWVCMHQAFSIMDALREALGNPARRELMGIKARQVFEDRYSKTVAIQSWERVLNSVLPVSGFDKAKPVEVRSA